MMFKGETNRSFFAIMFYLRSDWNWVHDCVSSFGPERHEHRMIMEQLRTSSFLSWMMMFLIFYEGSP
jgi:hypothetical protein